MCSMNICWMDDGWMEGWERRQREGESVMDGRMLNE